MTKSKEKIIFILLTCSFFIIAFLLLFFKSMNYYLIYDEHQFIASAVLLSIKVLFPYRDYPYFHMPNLVFLYGFIYQFSDYLLLSARLFSTICATITLGLIFFTTSHLFKTIGYLNNFFIAAGSVILLITNYGFISTSGLSWNHDLPVLLTLAAFLTHCSGIRYEQNRYFFLSGLLIGFAIGTRLSFAPALIPFYGVLALHQPKKDGKLLRSFCWFSLGVIISLLPAILLFLVSSKKFLFDNLSYANLNTIYRQKTNYQVAMDTRGKLIYIYNILSTPSNALLLLIFIYYSITSKMHSGENRKHRMEFAFIAILLPFLLIGALAPTPSWPQYFFVLIPFIIVGIVYLMADSAISVGFLNRDTKLFLIVVMLSMFYGIPHYLNSNYFGSPNRWVTTRVHKLGSYMAKVVGNGKILTLSPIFPLEGGLEIYEEFAVSPFAWRTASLLTPKERKEFQFVAADDLEGFLQKKGLPRGILVGTEPDLEPPLINYAEKNEYFPLIMPQDKDLTLYER